MPVVDENDFAYAKEKGVMFDPITITHDECVEKIVALASLITPQQVGRAFLSSLSTRCLEWRSAIASYHITSQLSEHHFKDMGEEHYRKRGMCRPEYFPCGICGDTGSGLTAYRNYVEEDLNMRNLERIKYGGLRRYELLYVMFDLMQFERDEIPEPTAEDISLFRQILAAADSCPKGVAFGYLRDALKEIKGLKSNHNERSNLLDTLAYIGVLQPSSYDHPASWWSDWRYIMYWRGGDGINPDALRRYFPPIKAHREDAVRYFIP